MLCHVEFFLLYIEASIDIFCICFFIVVPSFRIAGSMSSSHGLLDSLFIQDGLLIVHHILELCLLPASLILFLNISNPFAASVLMISYSKVSTSSSAGIVEKFVLLKL